MVYRGRPSTGCKKCRERKIKCDEQIHGCIRCRERGIVCPGYDRTIDAFFHDESAHVREKAQKSKAKAIAARDARFAQQRGLVSCKPQDPKTYLVAPIVEQAINFFMTHYTTGLDQPSMNSQGYNQHLSTDGFHPLVATTMVALGMASLANLHVHPGLKHQATRWYLDAIKLANAAITSPEEVRSDTTLIAVNLLSMFEATFNDKSLQGWSSHVDGAALLVKMRGIDQFSSPAGRRMYLHTIGLLTMNCMGQGKPMPDYVLELNKQVEQYMNVKDPRHAFFFLHIKANDLRSQILNQPVIDLKDIIDRSLELDDIAVSIFRDVDPAWEYDIVPCAGHESGVYGDFYHVYPADATAQTWNWVRYNRIYFRDLIRNCILSGFAASPPILEGQEYVELLGKSTKILQQLQSEILASMPQFLHDTPKVAPLGSHGRDLHAWSDSDASSPPSTPPVSPRPIPSLIKSVPAPTSKNTPRSFFENFRVSSVGGLDKFVENGSIKDRLPIVRISGGYSTLWALYVAGSMPTATPPSQDFVLYCLNRIEHDFGLNQAKVLAEALITKRRMDSEGRIPFAICPQYLPPDGGPYVPFQGMDSKKLKRPLAIPYVGPVQNQSVDTASTGIDDVGWYEYLPNRCI